MRNLDICALANQINSQGLQLMYILSKAQSKFPIYQLIISNVLKANEQTKMHCLT